MKKDRIKDYATAAFRDFAAGGCKSFETLRNEIYNAALLDAASELKKKSPPLSAVVRAEKAVEDATPFLLDMLAVEKTLAMLESGNKDYIAAAVRAVYFTDARIPLHKHVISSRVRRFAAELPASEITVYRYLKQARQLFAAVRGLTCDKDNC